jgi:hypothetical protein
MLLQQVLLEPILLQQKLTKLMFLVDFLKKCRSNQSRSAHSTVCRVLKFCVGIKRNKNVKLVPFTAGGLFSPNSSFVDDPPNVIWPNVIRPNDNLPKCWCMGTKDFALLLNYIEFPFIIV